MASYLAAAILTMVGLVPSVVVSAPNEFIVGLTVNVSEAVEQTFTDLGCSLEDVSLIVHPYQFHLYDCSGVNIDVYQCSTLTPTGFCGHNIEVEARGSPPENCWSFRPRCENWGLARLAQEDDVFNRRTPYNYETEMLADIYILDTGIRLDHAEFQGRAVWGYTAPVPLASDMNFTDPDSDHNGHGTHVAGVAIGSHYGVAKNARAISVKVLDHNGKGFLWGVAQGMMYALGDLESSGSKAVINLSLGGEYSTLFNEMVKSASSGWCPVVTAAGDMNLDACAFSPSTTGGGPGNAITVGATDRDDYMTSHSNSGACVSVLAPGKCIRAAFHTSTSAFRTLDGTSSSAAFVSGVLARYSAANPGLSPNELKEWLLTSAATGMIDIPDWKSQTPNKLVQSDCFDHTPCWTE